MTEKKRTFIYQERDDELLKKRMEKTSGYPERNSIYKPGFNIFKPKVSQQQGKATTTNRIRILPPTWKNAEHYGVEIFVHYNIGASRSTFICNKMMGRGECPICEEIQRRKEDKEYVSKIKTSRKVIIWLIDREDEQAGPKLWTLPISLDRNLAFQANDEDTGKVLKIDHPEKGYDVYFDTIKGAVEGIPFTYEGEKIARTSKPVFADEGKMMDVLDFIQAHPIPDVLNFKDYDYIKGVFEGNEVVKEEVEEVVEEEEEEKEEVKEEEGLSYKELKEMDRDDLEDIALEKAGLKNREIKGMEDAELVEVIAERLGITNKVETTAERVKRQLSSLKERG